MAGRLGSSLQSGPAVTCMKILLMSFNFIFWISGIAILALGIWTKVELHKYMALTTQYYEETPYVLMGVGAVIILVGSLGCCCTVKGKSFLLYLYAVFLMVVFIAELSVAVSAFIYRGQLEDGFDEGLQLAMDEYNDNGDYKEAVDDLQSGLHCCGSKDYKDWFSRDWSGKGQGDTVPASCCKVAKDKCDYEHLPEPSANQTSLDIYTKGCHSKISSFMEKNFAIIGGVAIGFAFLQLFGALLACSLAKNINKAKYEQVA